MSTEVNKNQGLLEAALEISARRRNTLLLCKQAIRAGNLKEADRLITELVPDEKVPGITQSQHVRTGRRGSRVVAFPANNKQADR